MKKGGPPSQERKGEPKGAGQAKFAKSCQQKDFCANPKKS